MAEQQSQFVLFCSVIFRHGHKLSKGCKNIYLWLGQLRLIFHFQTYNQCFHSSKQIYNLLPLPMQNNAEMEK